MLPVYYNQKIEQPDLNTQNLYAQVTLPTQQGPVISVGNPFHLHPPIVEVMDDYQPVCSVFTSATATSNVYFIICMVHLNESDNAINPLNFSSEVNGNEDISIILKANTGNSNQASPGPIASICGFTSDSQKVKRVYYDNSSNTPTYLNYFCF